MRGKRILERLAAAADLPDEALPGLPLIEIAGDGRVLIENHRGVAEYGTKVIRVLVKYGQVCVQGEELELIRMSRCQLIITGKVDGVQLLRGCR